MMRTLRTLVLAGAIAGMIAYGSQHSTSSDQHEYKCDTDDECVQECLAHCASVEGCDDCFDVFITAENYDLYEHRVSELLYKYEAY